jgi:5'-nucleotidase / UDP-sugar diphosphatase
LLYGKFATFYFWKKSTGRIVYLMPHKFVRLVMLGCLLMLLPLSVPFAQAQTGGNATITVIGMADYHSYAVPFYSEGQANQAGIARTLAYLKSMKASTPNLLVLSGGDTMNLGTPTWSDEYKCTEWAWFNGLVDAMALGNHEFDYGPDEYKKCAASIKYPIISGNFVNPTNNQPLLTVNGKPYVVKEIGGIKLGLFALAGSDFERLVRKELRPDAGIFSERLPVAQQIVKELRETEKVNAVIYFGHSSREDDFEMAQKVPGVDLVLGSHSHFKGELTKIPNTETWFISPFQYLTYLSQAQLKFEGGKLTSINGQLVKMDATKPQDAEYAQQVQKLQADLETRRPERFKVLGTAGVELSDTNISTDETVIGNWAMDTVRLAAGTHAFFSTSSSFRASIPPGPVSVEKFFTAIPYKNSIVTGDMTGQQLTDIINKSVSRRTSDTFSQLSGVRFKINGTQASDIQVVTDPTAKNPTYAALDPNKVYKVGTTNFQAQVAVDYKDLFAKATNLTDTKRDIGELLTATIQNSSPVTARLDGRMGTAVPQGGVAAAGVGGTSQAATGGFGLTLALVFVAIAIGSAGLLVLRKRS